MASNGSDDEVVSEPVASSSRLGPRYRKGQPSETDAELLADWLGERDPLIKGLREPWLQHVLELRRQCAEYADATYPESIEPLLIALRDPVTYSAELCGSDIAAAIFYASTDKGKAAGYSVPLELDQRMEVATYGELLKDRLVNLSAKVDTKHKGQRRWRVENATASERKLAARDPDFFPGLLAMVSDSSDTEEINIVSDEEDAAHSANEVEVDDDPFPVIATPTPSTTPVRLTQDSEVPAMSEKRAGKQRARDSPLPAPVQPPTPESDIDDADDADTEALAPAVRSKRVKASRNGSGRNALRKPSRSGTARKTTLPSFESYFAEEIAPRARERPAASPDQPRTKSPKFEDEEIEESEQFKPLHPHDESELHNHFYKEPLPTPLNKHTKPLYELDDFSVTRNEVPTCLLDLAFAGRRSRVIVVGTARPDGDTGKSRRRILAEGEDKKQVELHGADDVVALIAGVDHLILESKFSRFRLSLLPDGADQVFANARLFLKLLEIGRRKQIVGIGRTEVSRPTRTHIQKLIADFRQARVDRTSLNALEDFAANPIAFLLVKSLRSPSWVHPYIFDRLQPYLANMPSGGAGLIRTDAGHDPSIYQARAAADEAVLQEAHLAVQRWKEGKSFIDEEVYFDSCRLDGGPSASFKALFDSDSDASATTQGSKRKGREKASGGDGVYAFWKATIDGVTYQAGEFVIIEGVSTHPRDGKKSNATEPTPPPAQPAKRRPVALEFEFLADSETDDQEDQEADEAREKVVEDGEPWIGRIGYFYKSRREDGELTYFVHLHWFEKCRDGQLRHHAHPLRLFAINECGDVDTTCIVKKIAVERLPAGVSFSKTSSFFYSTVADDGSYEDAETIEEAAFVNTQIFVDLRVVECKCCDRKLSAALEKKVIPADPPKAIADRTRKSERALQIYRDDVQGEKELFDPSDFTDVCYQSAVPTSYKFAGITYHIGDFVLYNFQYPDDADDIPGPLRLARLTDIAMEILPNEKLPRLRLDLLFRASDLVTSDTKDERHIVLSSITDTTQTADALCGRIVVYHSSEWKDDYLADSHRFHCSSSLCKKGLEDEQNRLVNALHNNRDGRHLGVQLKDVGVDELLSCPACRAENDAHDIRRQEVSDLGPVFPLVECYAGVGGLCTGLKDGAPSLGLHLAIEKDPIAAKTLSTNISGALILNAACEEVLENPAAFVSGDGHLARRGAGGMRRAGVVSGGFPCQAFSSINTSPLIDDPRCWEPWVFMSWIWSCRPPLAIFENVRAFSGFAMPGDIADSPRRGGLLNLMVDVLLDAGYHMRYGLFQGAASGVPQCRHRLFLVAALRGIPLPRLPQATHAGPMTLLELPTGFRNDINPKRKFEVAVNPAAPHPMVTLSDALDDLRRFGYANPDPQPGHPEQPYVTTPFRPRAELGWRGATKYESAPRTTAQKWSRKATSTSGDVWQATTTVDLHFTAGFTKKVYASRLSQIITNYESLSEDIRPKIPNWMQILKDRNPKGTKVLKALATFWARADPLGILTPMRTSNHTDGSHGPRNHHNQGRKYSVREFARCQGFPDDHGFVIDEKSMPKDAERLIGNAVPVPLSRAFGREIQDVLDTVADLTTPDDPFWRLHNISALYKASSEMRYPPGPNALAPEAAPDAVHDAFEDSVVADSAAEMSVVEESLDERPCVEMEVDTQSESEESVSADERKARQRMRESAPPFECLVISDSDDSD